MRRLADIDNQLKTLSENEQTIFDTEFVGVFLRTKKTKNKSENYVARSYEDGQEKQKTFSLQKYGPRAKLMAVKEKIRM